jgi:hypothetical protein
MSKLNEVIIVDDKRRRLCFRKLNFGVYGDRHGTWITTVDLVSATNLVYDLPHGIFHQELTQL